MQDVGAHPTARSCKLFLLHYCCFCWAAWPFINIFSLYLVISLGSPAHSSQLHFSSCGFILKCLIVINICKYLKEGITEDGARLFPVLPSVRSRGTGRKLEHWRLPLNIGHNFCAVQVMETWHRLHREVVRSPQRSSKPIQGLQNPFGQGLGHPVLGVPA